jgi:hypothetical protein
VEIDDDHGGHVVEDIPAGDLKKVEEDDKDAEETKGKRRQRGKSRKENEEKEMQETDLKAGPAQEHHTEEKKKGRAHANTRRAYESIVCEILRGKYLRHVIIIT